MDPNYQPYQHYPQGQYPQPKAHVVPVKTNHALHLLLTLLTFWFFGGWLWVWIIVAISNHGRYKTIYTWE